MLEKSSIFNVYIMNEIGSMDEAPLELHKQALVGKDAQNWDYEDGIPKCTHV
jgi:hypothetical protein